jgi:Family of unknown function (DUF6364)
MQTKLTLRLDQDLIRRAKSHSRRSGKSLSALVADFFTLLSEDRPAGEPSLPPRVRSLIGAFKGSTATKEDYRKHLAEKYR